MTFSSRSRIFALSLAGLLGLGYVTYSVNRAPASSASVPAATAKPAVGGAPAVAVEVAKAVARTFSDDVSAVGTLKSHQSVILRAETAGRIAAIGFKDGAVVARGVELVQLDAAIQQAELQQARAQLALALSSHQRNLELLGRRFLSQQAVDNSAATLKVQEAAVQLAEAKLARTRIKAPFGGVVGLRNVSVGDFIKEGQDLINIEDIGRLRVDFKVPETYLGRLRAGQIVELTSDALPSERLKAVLDAVDPQVDPNGRAISARARFDNAAGKLRPGMFVRVRLVFGERSDVLMIPEQAVVTGGQTSVFKVVDGKAVVTRVRLGVRRASEVEVLDGVAAGDVVVTAGQLKLRDGVAVRPVGDGVAEPPSAPVAAAAK